jgi:hypothetical protein
VRISIAWAGALLVLLLAGCDGASTARGEPSRPSVPPPPPSTVPSVAVPPLPPPPPSLLPLPAGMLVEFERQGGLAGFDDRLTLRADGSYEVGRRGAAVIRGKLSPAEVANLRGVLDGSRFSEIPAVNAASGVADGFTYRIAYAGHEVLAQDGAVPPALAPVLTALGDLLAR